MGTLYPVKLLQIFSMHWNYKLNRGKIIVGFGIYEREICIDGLSKLLRYVRNCKIDSVFDVNVGNTSLMHILMSSLYIYIYICSYAHTDVIYIN